MTRSPFLPLRRRRCLPLKPIQNEAAAFVHGFGAEQPDGTQILKLHSRGQADASEPPKAVSVPAATLPQDPRPNASKGKELDLPRGRLPKGAGPLQTVSQPDISSAGTALAVIDGPRHPVELDPK